MVNPTDYPLLLFVISSIALWLSAQIGWAIRKGCRALDEELREDFGLILAATLTLLGLIIGFSFYMATSRYDQRKNYEEAEANAIGTEFVRADLLPEEDATRARCYGNTYTSEFCSMRRPTMIKSFSKSMHVPHSCRTTYGPRSVPQLRHSQHL